MQQIIGFIAALVIMIVPIKIAVNIVGTRRKSIVWCAVALSLCFLLSAGLKLWMPIVSQNQYIWLITSAFASMLIFMLIFDTTIKKAIIIGIIYIVSVLVLYYLVERFIPSLRIMSELRLFS